MIVIIGSYGIVLVEGGTVGRRGKEGESEEGMIELWYIVFVCRWYPNVLSNRLING